MEWILLFPLAPMICQDFKCRNVLLWQLLLFGAMQVIVCFCSDGTAQTGYHTLINFIVLIIIGAAVTAYAYFRFKPKQQLIGSGDLIFILLLAPYFSCLSFLHFLIVSFLLALTGWRVEAYLQKKEVTTIPLISYLGICYAIVVIYNSFSSI